MRLRLTNLQICTEIMMRIELEIGFILLPEREQAGSALVQSGMCGFDSIQERFHDMGPDDFESTFMRQ